MTMSGSTCLVLGNHEEAIEEARVEDRAPVAKRDHQLIEVCHEHVLLLGASPWLPP